MADQPTNGIVEAAQLDLDNALFAMELIGSDFAEAITGLAIRMNNYQRAKDRVELIEAGALINPEVTGAYTNEKQRLAAVKVFLAADVDYLAALEQVYQTYAQKAKAEGSVEEMRLAASASKRKCEMLVAVARSVGAE